MSYPNKTVELKLEYPVEYAGKTIEMLTIRRPKVRDNMIAGKKKMTQIKRSRLCRCLLALMTL